jgi:MFS family permease
MQMLAPDILDEVRQLPIAGTVTGLVAGLLLWGMGGRGYRFWMALTLTVTAGLLGLLYGRELGTQPLVAGLLLAVAAGVLALALMRLILFLLGGALALALMQALAPQWNEPLICFLCGGLLGALLYRVWVTVLSSLLGTLLLGYCGLGLALRLGWLKDTQWAERNAPLLNWALAGVATAGLVLQLVLERRRRLAEKKGGKKKAPKKKEPSAPEKEPPEKEPWWKMALPPILTRRAG